MGVHPGRPFRWRSVRSPGAEGSFPGRANEREPNPQWGVVSGVESRWPAIAAAALAIVLQVVLPDRVIRGLGPRWLFPALGAALLIALLATNPGRITREEPRLRALSIAVVALVNLANLVSLIELLHALLYPTGGKSTGRSLVYASIPIWITNVIVFALWFWLLDRGGPAARAYAGHRRPDFLFPQMSSPASAPGWSPKFFDYLYTSFTNATAFSPTDTMPLTPWAKLLMMVQSMISLLTVALVISRAVNILS